MKKGFYFGLITLLSLLMFSSCITQDKLLILQTDKEKEDVTEFTYNNEITPYTLKVGDLLYINITSMDEKSNKLFNSAGEMGSASVTENSMYLTGYLVDETGAIKLPMIGSVQALGKTTETLQKEISEKVEDFALLPIVSVKLIQFSVSILGEVTRPGKYTVSRDKLNILEALAMAGDLQTYANRRKIQLIRSENEKTYIYKINLHDANIVESPFYNLKPNDILYVEPLRNRMYAFETFPYGLFLSSITTILVILNFFKK